MNHQDRPVRAIVLAAQRPGTTDPLAARFGVTHKCLVPLRGRELILHVLAALSRHRGIAEIVVSIEPEAFGTIDALAASLGMASRIRCVPAASNLAESILAAAGRHDGPLLVTTADNALLLPASVEAVVEGMRASDAVVAMTPESAVRAAHPEGQRRFYRFRDQGYSNCNLYGIAHREALRAAEIFRGGGQFARKAHRIIAAFGLVNLILLRFRLIGLQDAMGRISRRLGIRLSAVVIADGSQAIDVDNDRTYRVVHDILLSRDLPPASRLAAA